ncbi:hypothetical protein CSAL01_12356 [Colletotrichum salicis]|uniref:Uncharacterized protein n=1 Tax=Colletotrichum salicis TaxID=1209931 RepID=A0A135U9R8_9PEZI|nr:hypothetical protein CSAL01_12356 [Colletotrichum salicis]
MTPFCDDRSRIRPSQTSRRHKPRPDGGILTLTNLDWTVDVANNLFLPRIFNPYQYCNTPILASPMLLRRPVRLNFVTCHPEESGSVRQGCPPSPTGDNDFPCSSVACPPVLSVYTTPYLTLRIFFTHYASEQHLCSRSRPMHAKLDYPCQSSDLYSPVSHSTPRSIISTHPPPPPPPPPQSLEASALVN